MTYRVPTVRQDTFAGVLAGLVLALIIGAIIALGSLPGRWASESEARHALEVQGFSNVQLVQRHIWFTEFLGCSKEDVVKFDFTATNPVGKQVEVHVCEGWPFKGATVRY